MDEAGGRDCGSQEKNWLYDSDGPGASRTVVGEVFSEPFRFIKVERLTFFGSTLRRDRRCSVVLHILI
jgi:hypothetical protein